MAMKDPKLKCSAVLKTAVWGGLIFSIFSIIAVIGYDLIGGSLFFSLYFYANIVTSHLFGNTAFPWPFNNTFSDQLLCVVINFLAGLLFFLVPAFIWHFCKKDSNEK